MSLSMQVVSSIVFHLLTYFMHMSVCVAYVAAASVVVGFVCVLNSNGQ